MKSVFDIGTEYHCVHGHVECPLPKRGSGHMNVRYIKHTDDITVAVHCCDEHKPLVDSFTLTSMEIFAHPKVVGRFAQLRVLSGSK